MAGLDGRKLKAAISFCLLVVFCATFFVASSVVLLKRDKAAAAKLAENPTVKIWRSDKSAVEELPLEEIVIGVLSAEMPASFEPQALQAQAVAARTYILKRLPEPWGSGQSVHQGNAYICDDYAHCQAYSDEAERRSKWGDDFEANEAKIRAAVTATSGEVLTCGGELISPSFHSTCGGSTEAAVDYWQSEVPALQAVPCYWDSSAPRYLSTVSFTREELAAKLEVSVEALAQLTVTEESETGRVKQVTCGAASWKGSAFRTVLGLNSTNFAWLATPERFLFTVQGYGHGVGLCQHGANGMAQNGADYMAILEHYYTDIELTRISELTTAS